MAGRRGGSPGSVGKQLVALMATAAVVAAAAVAATASAATGGHSKATDRIRRVVQAGRRGPVAGHLALKRLLHMAVTSVAGVGQLPGCLRISLRAGCHSDQPLLSPFSRSSVWRHPPQRR